MSGVAVIVFMLNDSSPLIAGLGTVGGIAADKRIAAGDLPLGTLLPALSVHQISDVARTTVAMNESKTLITEYVQVTVHAKTYPQQKALLELVRKACPHRTGTINGVDVVSILPEGAGPDLPEADTGNQVQARDFIVKWRAAN